MADYYLTVNGEYFDEAGDFNDGIDYVFECHNEGVDAVLCVTGGNATPLTGTEFYLKGASTTITGGVITGWVYCGFNSVSSEEVIKSQEIILDGGTISGNLSLGSQSGDSYVENVTLTVKSGIITGQILTGNTGHVGDVTMNFLGGDLRNTISCTAMAGTGKTGNVVVNFDGYSNASRWLHAAYRGSAESVTINVKQGHLHLMNLGAGLAGAVATMPVTLNLTGGTINNICLNYTATSALIGDVTVNMSGGVVNTNFRMGNWSQGAADFVESTGTTTINLTGGSVNTDIYGGGTAIHKGDVVINISGTYHSSKIIYAGAPNGPGLVDGNTTITVSGGTWEGSSYWLMGGGKYGKTTGKATINIQEGANVYHIFGGGREAGSDVLGGVEINVSGGEIHGVCQGAGYRSNIEGGVNINVTGGTFCRDMKASYWVAGYIIGGASNALPVIKGDINVSVSGAVVHGGIIGGSYGGTIEGNITMNISGITVGTVSDGVVDGGGITIFADNQAEIIGNATATITDVTAYGNLYISTTGANYIEGDATVTVANSSFANIALEKGYFFEEVNEETGEITIGETRETEINGNVLFDLTNVTVSGNVYGQSLKLNLVKFSEEGQGAALAVSGKLTVAGEVAYFQNITIAAGASIEAASVTASAITATAAAEDGAYLLATGFAAQDSVITVVNGDGSTIGTVTLSEAVTSGSFNAGSDAYTVAISGTDLYLTKNAEVPAPPAPPVVENTTTAEIILTISDANHPSFGATGGWKVQTDQTVVWQDLSTLSGDFQILGQGYTVAGKAMTDIYIYSASAKYVGAYTTDDTGAITGFESIFTGENALMQVGLGDFTADGVSDLMLRTADGYLGFYANGAFTAVQGLGTEWSVEALGDVNGDGTTDIVIAHANGGYVGAYLIGKDGGITWGDLGSTEGGIEIVGAGDFNADGTDDVLVKSGSYYGAWLCGNGAVTGFFGIGTFEAEVQDIADYNADGTDDVLFRTADGIVGAALITGADASTWAQYGALGAEWSTKGVGIL